MATHDSRVPVLTERFEEALKYAIRVHRYQERKGGEGIPYAAHLLSVAALVVENGADENVSIAALLHDAVEDQGGEVQLNEIRKKFGKRIATLVEGCTEKRGETHGTDDWRPRKEAHVEHLAAAPDDVLLIVAADKLHNARAILQDFRKDGMEVFKRFSAPAGAKDVVWYYRAMSKAISSRIKGYLPEELKRVVDKIAQKVNQSRRPRRRK